MTHPTPARLYRDAVRSLFLSAPKEAHADDVAFLAYLEAEYADCVERLTQEQNESGEGVTLFIIATGLLAFGRLDVVDPVLSPPDLSGGIARLAFAPWALLPLPASLRVSRDVGQLRDWLSAHADRLVFREDLGCFTLADGSG